MITRRSLLRAAVVAAMAPVIELRNSVPDEKLMLAFCDPDCNRYDLNQPFGVGSLTYASDTWAMVRADIPNRVEIDERRLPRNVSAIWQEHWHPDRFVPLTESLMTPTEPSDYPLCPVCGDARVKFTPDHKNPEHVNLCRVYDFDPDEFTIRDRSCECCSGLDYVGPDISNVCGIRHRSFYLRRIAALPNAKVCRSRSVASALLFVADGFEGISLGIIPENASV
jgi:hypothetical protein